MPVARLASSLLTLLLASTALIGVAPARAQGLPAGGQGLPTGAHVVSGGVTIGTPTGGAMTITQSSPSAIVNWQGFSIGSRNRVDIRQPDAQSAILNRVTGNTPSTIAGQLNANGQVYLVNPNGITITRSGQVNAGGGFVASTLGIADEDFKAGRRQFRGSGASAKVTNHGTVTVGRGGYAALIGGRVSNSGLITVPMGKVGLGSGERATLDLSGDGFLQVQVPTNAKGRGALVFQSGTISADGGSVVLSAAAARDMARQAVNLSGTVEARTVSGRNGSITLSGGDGAVAIGAKARLDVSGIGAESGGRVRAGGRHLAVAGRIDASGARGGRVSLQASETADLSGLVLAQGTTGPGGRVTATAPDLSLHSALIDASGATGGGTVRIGGGRQGAGGLAHARTLEVDAVSVVRADATGRGRGGDVVLWSDFATRFSGTISARGGAAGGDGGEAEVSSKGVLAYAGFADLTAARGRLGTLLLDPYNITISSGTDTNQAGFTATGTDSVINSTTLLTALGRANVTVSTGTGGSQAGTITLAAGTPLSWNTGATLTLQAAGAVTLNGSVTAPAGGLTIAAGTGTSTATADISVARFTLASGTWAQNTATLPAFATGDFRVADGASFLRVAGGAGTSADPYRLADIYGVQGMGTSATTRAASYRLAGAIDASGTAGWNGGLGFSPVGKDGAAFTGSLDGAGFAIGGLTIARPSQNHVGLFGYLAAGATVSNIGIVGGSVTGRYYVGGLIGQNAGTVSQAYATASVTSTFSDAGGLVGGNNGILRQSYATGSVNGVDSTGGLVGSNVSGTIDRAYATGSVSGRNSVGGLVGYSNSDVSQAYATGPVSGSGNSIGGLIGYYGGGTLSATYWDTQSTGRSSATGSGAVAGATALTSAQARSQAGYTNANDSSQNFDFGTVWYQARDLRPILRSEAAAADANGVIAVSNLHQLQLMGVNLSGTYRLTANIDASATNSTEASPGIFGAGGFVPVGTGGNGFTGSLDGAARTISGLTINRPSESTIGLIGLLDGGSVSRLGLTGSSITGGFSDIGGMIGVIRNGRVDQASADGTVVSTLGGGGGGSVGGLSGGNVGGTITRSFAAGSVTSPGDYVGGLVGYNNGTISQSYATGSVTGNSYSVGGLIGHSDGTVSQVYATGPVGGTAFYAGGLIGELGSPLSAAYWDTQTTLQANAAGTVSGALAGTAGRTTAQMQDLAAFQTNFAGFDFTNGWTPPNQAGQGGQGTAYYPQLASLSRVLTVTPTTSRAYGDANPGLIASYSGVRPGDFVTTLGSLTTSATATSNVGTYAATASGAAVTGNTYRVLYLPGSLTIDPRPVTVTADTQGRLYGEANAPLTFTTTSLGAGAALSGTLATAATATSNIGSYAITQGSLTAATNPNYAITYAGANLVVAQRPVTVTATGQSRLYGDANPSLSFTSTSLGAGAALSGTLATSATATSDVGSYAITQGTLTAAANPNYALTYAGANLVVAQRPVTITATGQSRLYGDANPSLSFTSTSLGAGAALSGTLATAATATSDVGSYAITQGTLTAAANPNYALTYAGANLTVAQRPVTVTATGQNRLYGDANSPLTFANTSLGAGAALSGTLATTAAATSDIGSYPLTQGSLTAVANPNYALTYTGASIVVAPRPVTVTATGQTRLYGDANPSLSFTSTSLGAGAALSGTLASTATAASDVGTYAITQGSLTAAANPNYALAYTGANLVVGQRPLTVTADARSRVYGDVNPALTYQVGGGGLANGDRLSGSLATATDVGSAVGAYRIGQGSLAATGNYAMNYVGADLTVTARPLTLTADAQSRVYGEANPALTYTVGGRGLVNGDALTGALTTTAATSSSVGTYAIGQGNLAASPNYAVSYVGADLAVTARPLTVTADAQSRVYGEANPALTYTVRGRGLVNGDALTGALTTTAATGSSVGTYSIGQGNLTASGNYAMSYVGADLAVTARPLTITADTQSRVYGDANPVLSYKIDGRGLVNGDALTGALTTTAATGSSVGTYAIGQGNLAASPNYAVSYVGADLAVTARPLTLTADAQSRIYGDANPALTYTVGGRGLVNGDALTGALTTTAATGSSVGTYAIGQGSLAASPNYTVSYVGADLAVTARPIALTADAQSRVYGEANPTLSYQVGGRGLANGDSLSGGLSTTAADARSAVGTYSIGQGSLAASGNYTVRYIGSDLAVTARPITVTADTQSRVYGDTNPALTYTVGGRGLANGDALTGAMTTTAATGSSVGTYSIGQGSLAASPNYTVSYVGADLAVTARPLTVTADAQSRVYGDANPTLSFRVAGRGLANGDALTGALTTTAATGSSVGSYAIGQGNLAASPNYAVSYVGADLVVTARPLTVTADAQSRVYGDANPALTYTVGGRGLVNGDALSGALTTTAATSSSVGTHAIGQGNLATSPNYAVSYVGADLAVTARPLTLTADAQSRVYGDVNPTLSYQVGGRGLANGDSLSGGLSTTVDAHSAVGTYSIGQGSLASSGNYAVRYIGSDLAVTARPITVTADTQSRVYGDTNPALTYTVGGRGL
ncbi:filamentous hemagglutinin N-terminal domain-containing protein, partial [Methylobacterium terricola]